MLTRTVLIITNGGGNGNSRWWLQWHCHWALICQLYCITSFVTSQIQKSCRYLVGSCRVSHWIFYSSELLVVELLLEGRTSSTQCSTVTSALDEDKALGDGFCQFLVETKFVLLFFHPKNFVSVLFFQTSSTLRLRRRRKERRFEDENKALCLARFNDSSQRP